MFCFDFGLEAHFSKRFTDADDGFKLSDSDGDMAFLCFAIMALRERFLTVGHVEVLYPLGRFLSQAR